MLKNRMVSVLGAVAVAASALAVAAPAAHAGEVCKPGTKGLGYCQINVGGRITLQMNLRGSVWATAQHNRPVHLDRTNDGSFRTWSGPLGGGNGSSSTYYVSDSWWRACARLDNGSYACTGFHKWNEY